MTGPDDLALDTEAASATSLEALLSGSTGSSPAPSSSERPARPVSNERDTSQRIAAILDAAEEEAERIRERARAEASGIIRAAHAAAGERIDELVREPERVRDEAERTATETVRAAEESAARELDAANRKARDTVREAEHAAETQRREAEQAAAEMERTMRARQQQLKDETRMLGELRQEADGAMRHVVDVLHDLAADLSRKLMAVPGSAPEPEDLPPAAVAEPAPLPHFDHDYDTSTEKRRGTRGLLGRRGGEV